MNRAHEDTTAMIDSPLRGDDSLERKAPRDQIRRPNDFGETLLLGSYENGDVRNYLRGETKKSTFSLPEGTAIIRRAY